MRDAMGLAGLERQLAVVLKVHVEIRHSLIDGHGLAGRGIGIASRGSRSSVVAVDVDGGTIRAVSLLGAANGSVAGALGADVVALLTGAASELFHLHVEQLEDESCRRLSAAARIDHGFVDIDRYI